MLPAGAPATMNTRNILMRRTPPRGNDLGAEAGGGAGEWNEGPTGEEKFFWWCLNSTARNNPFNGAATLAEVGIDWRLRPGAGPSPSGVCDKVL